MAVWSVVLALLCASCGRIAFDPRVDAAGGDAGSMTPMVQHRSVVMLAPEEVVQIEPVDAARTMVLCDFRTATSSIGYQPACELTDAQTVTVTTFIGDPDTVVEVQVVQLPEGSEVQRGAVDITSGELVHTIPIAPIDLTTTFPLVSRWGGVDASGLDERFCIEAVLDTATTLTLKRANSGNTVMVKWQVVHIAGARVIGFVETYADGGVGGTRSGFSLEPTRAFVVSTASALTAEERSYLFGARLSGPGPTPQLIFDRLGLVGPAEQAMYLVELTGATAQRGTVVFTTEAMISVPLPIRVDPSRAVALLSIVGGRAGQTSDLDEAIVTGTVLGDSLLLQRNATPPTDVGGTVHWTVVEWQ